jgi:hypothetical protein
MNLLNANRLDPLGMTADRPRFVFKSCHFLLAIQIILASALNILPHVLPFGFDHPSELGLDIGHLFYGACCFGLIFIGCVVTSIAQLRWGCFLLSFLVTIVGVVFIFVFPF